MSIAQTIRTQLIASVPRPVFWSWGASKWQIVKGNEIDGIGENYSGALMFYVRGQLHKGHVVISLNVMDEYTLTTGHVRKGKIKPIKQIKGIHFDMLGTILDGMIETK